MEVNGILESIAGNSVIAGILVWFMVQYQALVKKLMDKFSENTAVMKDTRDTLHEVRNAMVQCKAVDQFLKDK